nr:zinc finger, CCHC-type [Tanacetum cinerariifolium]
MNQKDLVYGVPAIKHTTQICNVCLVEKQSRAPFPKKAKGRSTSPLDLIYGDLCGPITPPTPSGKRYIFLLVDDYSRYMWAYFLRTKDQAFDTFKEFKKTIENKLRTTLKMFRMDHGGEFNLSEFTQYCKENGIARQLTAPYSPQQNGVVERRNRTIMSTTRCMMKATEMPQEFWAKAVRHAIYILNSVPTKALEPYEAIKGKKPNLKDLRVFGCIAYAKVPSQHLTKLDDRSIRMVYLGNEHGSKAYRLFDPTTQRICVSRDVKFKEDEKWDWSKYSGENTNDEPEWTDFRIGNPEETNDHHDLENHPNKEDNDFPYNEDDGYDSPLADSPTEILHTPLTRSPQINSQSSPNQSDEVIATTTETQSYFDHTPIRGYRTLTDIYENAEELLLAEDEPKNYKEASNDQKWIEAMKDELDSINRNNTWRLTSLPPGHKAIGLKWLSPEPIVDHTPLKENDDVAEFFSTRIVVSKPSSRESPKLPWVRDLYNTGSLRDFEKANKHDKNNEIYRHPRDSKYEKPRYPSVLIVGIDVSANEAVDHYVGVKCSWVRSMGTKDLQG